MSGGMSSLMSALERRDNYAALKFAEMPFKEERGLQQREDGAHSLCFCPHNLHCPF